MKTIQISNPQKLLYPQAQITKLDVIEYYINVAPLMLPFVCNRILTAVRCHDNIDNCFFKKHPTTDKQMVKMKTINKEPYFYLVSAEQLAYQVQMGTLEFHVGGSLVQSFNHPDIMIFDLDPDTGVTLTKLRDGVRKLKSLLDELNLTAFLKTSGGKGYHIVVPFAKTTSWESFSRFSEQIAKLAEQTWPTIFTTNIRKAERKQKIFIDYLRNNKNASCVAPYSLRARANATIAMPIAWEQLNKIKPDQVNIKNYKKYLNNAWSDFFHD